MSVHCDLTHLAISFVQALAGRRPRVALEGRAQDRLRLLAGGCAHGSRTSFHLLPSRQSRSPQCKYQPSLPSHFLPRVGCSFLADLHRHVAAQSLCASHKTRIHSLGRLSSSRLMSPWGASQRIDSLHCAADVRRPPDLRLCACVLCWLCVCARVAGSVGCRVCVPNKSKTY